MSFQQIDVLRSPPSRMCLPRAETAHSVLPVKRDLLLAPLWVSGVHVQECEEGPVGVVLGATSFYAESGGQVADCGVITAAVASFDVTDVQVGEGGF